MTTRRALLSLIAIPLAVVATLVACGGDDAFTAGAGRDAGSTGDAGLAASAIEAGVGPAKGPVVACAPDESAPVPTTRCTTDITSTTMPVCGVWTKVEIPGTVCGDGSQYKFFVNYSNTSNDLLVSFEPGGACWDYASCTGEGGTRGAANPNGIPDDHMSEYQYLNLLRRTDDNPAQAYNMVFASYCTGDIHTGDKVATYTSDGGVDGGGPATITFNHKGHDNTVAMAAWIAQTFPTVPKLFVTGCSAGGAGALLNYPVLRSALGAQAQCGYLLNDSGPIIRDAWNVDGVIADIAGSLPGTPSISVAALQADYGQVNTAIAQAYPKDRLAFTAYREDFNYSLYSYQSFYPGSTEAQIHAFYWQDLQGLIPTYDAQPNLAYYIPYFRTDNCSHCVSIPPIGNAPLEPTNDNTVLSMPWQGSDIPEDMIDLKAYTTTLLDDTQPMRSYLQAVIPTEMFTPAESMQCLE
jgi:hypothetical protein